MVAKSNKKSKFLYNARGRVTDYVFGLIKGLDAIDESDSEIARLLNVSRSTVQRQLEETLPPSMRKRHKPPQLSTAKKRAIAKRRARVEKLITTSVAVKKVEQLPRSTKTRTFHQFPYGSPQRVSRQLAIEGITASPATVRNDLKFLGIRCFIRRRRPVLSDDDKAVRVAFCKRMLRLPKEHLTRIHFSDEKIFDSNDHGDRFQYVKPGTLPEPRQVAQYPNKVHVWGVIGLKVRRLIAHRAIEEKEGHVRNPVGRPKKGAKRLTKEQTKRAKKTLVDADTHIERCLEPTFGFGKLPKGVAREYLVLMQDGAGCHIAKKTREWLEEHGIEQVQSWPPRSPDLNPIENLWGIIAAAVGRRGPGTKVELEKFVMEEWAKVKPETLNALVESFRGRLQKCIQLGGAHVSK